MLLYANLPVQQEGGDLCPCFNPFLFFSLGYFFFYMIFSPPITRTLLFSGKHRLLFCHFFKSTVGVLFFIKIICFLQNVVFKVTCFAVSKENNGILNYFSFSLRPKSFTRHIICGSDQVREVYPWIFLRVKMRRLALTMGQTGLKNCRETAGLRIIEF